MVRLKAQTRSSLTHAMGRFQFQNGTIKSWCQTLNGEITSQFQFQNGTIKSKTAYGNRKIKAKFQFQNGTIKSCEILSFHLVFPLFQFQNGTIKSSCTVRVTTRPPHFNSKMVRLKESHA